MGFHDALSMVAVVLSIITFSITLLLTLRRDVVALKPMLVFTYREQGWYIDNIGNGPALDVIFTRRRGIDDLSDKHVRIPALPKGAEFLLHFARRDNEHAFLATYTDAEQRRYTSESRHDASRIARGWKGIKRPDPSKLPRWWNLPDSELSATNHQQPSAKS